MADYTDWPSGTYCTTPNLALARPALEKIADKWTILILTVISAGPKRFNEIKRSLEGITHKALSDALKRLERNGLVTRTVLPTKPIGVEYAITPLGLSLGPPFQALFRWSLESSEQMRAASVLYDAVEASR